MFGTIPSLAIIIFSIISVNRVPVHAANSSSVSPSILQKSSFSALANLATGFFNECNCYTRSNCMYQGGIAYGSCGGYNNVCCILMKTCGTTVTANLTYFTNPSYPIPYNGGDRCATTIPKINSNICQLRLDLLDFSIAQPTSEGICDSDSLLISGSSTQVPRICGENSGQHIYMDYQGSTPITLYVHTNPDIAQSRRWNIQITQIECNSPAKAPSGCLQYHTSVSGTVTSFNYGTVNNPRLSTSSAVGTREMAKLNYGVCVRVEENYCSLRWSSADEDSFTISGDAAAAANATSGASCKTDYVIIPDPSESNVKTNVERYCGTKFITKITSLKPYALYVVTDDAETTSPTPDLRNRGFSLNYKQLICSL